MAEYCQTTATLTPLANPDLEKPKEDSQYQSCSCICLSMYFSPTMTVSTVNPDKVETITIPMEKYVKTK